MVPRTLSVILLVVFAGGVFASATQGPLRQSVTSTATATETSVLTHTQEVTTVLSRVDTTTLVSVTTATQPASTVVTTVSSTSVTTSLTTESTTQTVFVNTTITRSTTKIVTSTPTVEIAISPNYGCLGLASSVTVVGDGFNPSDTVSVWFNGGLVGSGTSGPRGAFSTTVTIGNGAPGEFKVMANDSLGDSASAAYTVVGVTPC